MKWLIDTDVFKAMDSALLAGRIPSAEEEAAHASALAFDDDGAPPLDLSTFSSLDRIILGGCAGLASLTLPVSAPAVFRLYVNNTGLSFIDISGLPGLSDVPMNGAQFTAAVIDDVLIKLDGFGKNNGSLNYNGNPGAPTLAALTAYNNLISKGWTITGPVPA